MAVWIREKITALLLVLRGKAKFVLYKNEPPISIDEVPAIIDPYDSYMCLQRYAVVDLLGDGTPELLTYVCGVAGDMAGYLLLWDEDGQVHGEIFDSHGWRNRWFDDLKADGTFLCSDALGVGWISISRLRFTAADGWTLYSEAVHRLSESPYNDGNGFSLESLEGLMVVERDCSDKEFQEALDGQRAKPDATWYKLPLKGFDYGPTPTQPTVPAIDPTSNSDIILDDTEALAAYRAVLSGNTTFHDTGTGKDLDIARISEVFNSEIFWISKYFTIIDLDGDGIREVVLMLDSAVLYGYEILHYQDGTVYGYYTIPRGFEDLKVDGTYEGSSSAFSGTVERIESFSENGFNEEILAEYDYHAYDYNGENEVHEYFAVSGQKASSTQIESVLSQQRAKESAQWYELTEENIEGLLG